MPTPLKLGPPVEHDEYFPRPTTEAEAWSLIGTGHHLLLLDPRRVGKTSFLRHLAATAKHPAIEVSVESAATEGQIVAEIYTQAAERSKRVADCMRKGQLGSFVERIRKLGAAGCAIELDQVTNKHGWATLGEELLAAIREDGDWLILLDELPHALRRLAGLSANGESRESAEGLQRVEQLLSWLRHARQRPGTRVRWVLAGSIGLDTLARRWRMTEQIQDLRVFRLGALSPEDARRFVAWGADRLRLSLVPDAPETILAAVGWPIPFHIGLVLQALSDAGARGTPEQVDTAITTLLDRDRRTHFDPWDQRLDRQFTPAQANLARKLLGATAADPKGRSIPHLRLRSEPDFEFVSDALQHDGYLVEEAGRLLFRSPLLRRWWTRHGTRA